MRTALLCVNIQYALLLGRKAGGVAEHFLTRQGRGDNSRDIEGLLALGLSRRGTEVSDSGDGRAFHFHNLGREWIFLGHVQSDVLKNLLDVV